MVMLTHLEVIGFAWVNYPMFIEQKPVKKQGYTLVSIILSRLNIVQMVETGANVVSLNHWFANFFSTFRYQVLNAAVGWLSHSALLVAKSLFC